MIFTETCQEALRLDVCFNGSEKFENYLSSPQILKAFSWIFIKEEYKFHPITYHKVTAGEYNPIPSLTSALVEMSGQHHAPGRFTSRNELVSIVYEAGCAPAPVWTSA